MVQGNPNSAPDPDPAWKAEWPIDVALAKRLIESQFPDLCPVRVEPFGEGWDNLAVLVNGRLVFRFPRRKLGAQVMQSELAVLPQLVLRLPSRSGKLVPQLTHFGRATDEFPADFAGYPRLPGVTACVRTWTEAERIRLAAALARFLADLHSIDADEAEQTGAPDDQLGRLRLPYRAEQGREHLHKALTNQLIDSPLFERLCRELDAAQRHPPAADGPHTLVHGDLYVRHLMVDEQAELTGVIDWGDVHRGHPAIDLAAAFCLLPAAGRRKFFNVYGEIDSDTRRLAVMRAIRHTAVLTCYAHDIDDEPLRRASVDSLARIDAMLQEEPT